MLHLRLISPARLTDAVLGVLQNDAAAFNILVLKGAALSPAGDVVQCDVAREGVNDIVAALRGLGLHHDGSIALDRIDVSVSDAAAAADALAPGHPSDAAVWEEVDARVRDDSTLTAGFVVFLIVAALIGVVGLIEDAPILIVGAMVVGPEFGPISGLAVGLFKRRASRIRTALATLVVGLGLGCLAAAIGTLLLDAAGYVPDGFTPHTQPLTGFVVEPSALSLVVALLAGVTGTLSLTQAKAGALIGVLISVTTIPAVAAIGVSGALRQWEDVGGAAVQLGVNVGALLAAAVITLWVQRTAWAALARGRTSARRGAAV